MEKDLGATNYWKGDTMIRVSRVESKANVAANAAALNKEDE